MKGVNMADAKFSLGQVVATPGAVQALREAQQSPDHFLGLHAAGAWGDLDREDRAANEQAIAHEGELDCQARVFSSYKTRLGGKIWLTREGERSVPPTF